MASRLPAVARPAVIAASAANASANHGSSRRSSAVSRRTSPGTVIPTAVALGVISASRRTRSG